MEVLLGVSCGEIFGIHFHDQNMNELGWSFAKP